MLTNTDIQKMEHSLTAEPWCSMSVSSALQPQYMYHSLESSPWFAIGGTVPMLGHIKAVNQVDWSKVKKFNGVSQSNIKTIINVEG